MDDMLARKEPFVCLLIMDSSASSPAHRKRVAQWNTDNKEELREHCRGFAMVMADSPVLRFIIGSMLVIMRQPVPYRVFATEDEALAWARLQLGTPPR